MNIRIKDDEIVKMICKDNGITLYQLKSRKRDFDLVDVRCIVANVFLQIGYPLNKIKKLINRSDHTTVINLVKRIENRPYLQRLVDKYVEKCL